MKLINVTRTPAGCPITFLLFTKEQLTEKGMFVGTPGCLSQGRQDTRGFSRTLSVIFLMCLRKEKHININKFAGLSGDWVGVKNLFMCFCGFIPYGEKTKHKTNPGTIRRRLCLRVFFLCCFLLPSALSVAHQFGNALQRWGPKSAAFEAVRAGSSAMTMSITVRIKMSAR